MPAHELHPTSATPSNGASALHDLFALTDEQILEIEPEAQDVEVHNSSASASPEIIRDSSSVEQKQEALPTDAQRKPVVIRADAQPPQWLAERMADPQAGAEARELWDGAQLARQGEQARSEAAAFREVFAKPEDARAAAQRARLLDDIDRTYFSGDSAQRSQLAAAMLHEDPGAFREMVFAGLRALEEAQKGNTASPGSVGTQQTAAQPDNASAVERSITAPNTGHGSRLTDHSVHLAAYAGFERSANDELERSVGQAIERTLEHALPSTGKTESAPLKGRLAATIRQDIEKALQGDRQLGEQVAQILAARRFDDESRAQVVRLIGGRAQQLVPSAAKRALSEWTQATLAAHRSQRDRSDSAEARREVEPVASAPAHLPASAPSSRSQARGRTEPARPASSGSRRVDYRKLSDEQILDL